MPKQPAIAIKLCILPLVRVGAFVDMSKAKNGLFQEATFKEICKKPDMCPEVCSIIALSLEDIFDIVETKERSWLDEACILQKGMPHSSRTCTTDLTDLQPPHTLCQSQYVAH